ncbi:mesenteric estrogen-dependent adipogenesis protein [Bombina bombina]|uniref:mesenteric estrogen-dependent adipogenesis protein n=1 Tax=Bombina bombina TaxID=8345 RepID=UPI00235A72DC|nr:mesenteric estrogen-dependent adipogenesis protein [Bombina bombina]
MAASGERSHPRLSSKLSLQSMSSVSSDFLRTVTTCNCEMALLPLKLLLDLQPEYLQIVENTLTMKNPSGGGYNLISDGDMNIDGQQCKIINYIQRKVNLKSHWDYKDYRENLLNKPMLFLTNAKKINSQSASERTFAFIVNTRHPKMRAQVEGGMNNVISSVFGENYSMQFEFQNIVKDFLQRQNFETTGETLSFSYTFKVDAFFDLFHLLGLSKKTCQVNGNIINLYCTTPSKKDTVKMFLSNMSNPLIRIGSSSDRRFSTFSLDVISEDPFSTNEEDITPISPLAS